MLFEYANSRILGTHGSFYYDYAWKTFFKEWNQNFNFFDKMLNLTIYHELLRPIVDGIAFGPNIIIRVSMDLTIEEDELLMGTKEQVGWLLDKMH